MINKNKRKRKSEVKSSRKKVLGIVLAAIMMASLFAGIASSTAQNESRVESETVRGEDVKAVSAEDLNLYSVSKTFKDPTEGNHVEYEVESESTDCEIGYDDGEWDEAGWMRPNVGLAVHFTNTCPTTTLKTARFYIRIVDNPAEFKWEVLTWTGSEPGSVIASGTTTPTISDVWHDVDVGGITVPTDFVIAMYWIENEPGPYLGFDYDEPINDRSLLYDPDGEEWVGPFGDVDFMIRAVMKEFATTELRVNVMPEYYTFNGTSNIIWGNCHWDPADTAHTGTYNWTFDDGTWETGTVSDTAGWDHAKYIAETHTYDEGVYEATLTVTSDFDGSSDSDTVRIYVYNAATLTADKLEEVKVNKAIEDGLRWLYNRQYPDGKWRGYNGYWIAGTGEAVLAFETPHGHLPSNDINEDIYAEYVQMGLDYLFGQLSVQELSDQTYIGNPDTNGNGIGLYWSGDRCPYFTPMGMMAIIGSLTPDEVATTGDATYVNGRTYRDIVRDVCDWLAWAQNEAGGGDHRGGWRYGPNYGTSDNSVAQWPALGLLMAENRWSITAPVYELVKDELELWLDKTQLDNGGFIYYPGYTGEPNQWVNIAKTGAGLIMLRYIGADTSDSRVVNATIYLNNTWDVSNADPGWCVKPYGYGSFYAMYAVYKGCKDAKPSEIEYLPLPGGSRDWYADFVDYLLNTQNADGSWPSGEHGDDDLDTMWSILTLSRTVLGGPVAVAGPNQRVSVHEPVTFDGSGSYHTIGLILIQYLWDFDASDGVDWNNPDASGEIVTYAAGYPASGTYTVTLRVKDELGNTDTDTAMVNVEPIISGDKVYFDPQESSAMGYCKTTEVEMWVNATEFKSGEMNLTYDPTCANVTNYVWNAVDFPVSGWTHYDGREWITFMTLQPSLTGNYQIGTLTIHCVNDDPAGCTTPLDFVEPSALFDSGGNKIEEVDWKDGTFECRPGICGDVNCDGKVNMGDVGSLHNYVQYGYPISDEWAADVNCDGKINMGDVGSLHNHVQYGYSLNCC